jgi:outer membrane murein-binding lipoprotein Lpp
MEAVRAADGSWRVEGEPADIEGLQAARARVAALEADVSATREAMGVASSRESAALQAAEDLGAAVARLEQDAGALRIQLEAVAGERDAARADLGVVRQQFEALNTKKEDPRNEPEETQSRD